jgi:hypothetical protein
LLQVLQVQQLVGELGLVWAQLVSRQQVLVLVRKVLVHSHRKR